VRRFAIALLIRCPGWAIQRAREGPRRPGKTRMSLSRSRRRHRIVDGRGGAQRLSRLSYEDLIRQQRLTDKQWAKSVEKMRGWGAPPSRRAPTRSPPTSPRPTRSAPALLAGVISAQRRSAVRGASRRPAGGRRCEAGDGAVSGALLGVPRGKRARWSGRSQPRPGAHPGSRGGFREDRSPRAGPHAGIRGDTDAEAGDFSPICALPLERSKSRGRSAARQAGVAAGLVPAYFFLLSSTDR